MSTMHAVVMAGGSGTRFWPASRSTRPKQLLPLAHGEPLLRATIQRLGGICDAEHTWVVTSPRQEAGVRQTLPSVPPERILVEPQARDTAPCVALAAAHIESVDAGAVFAVLPADHVIEPADGFHRMLRRGVAIASDGATLVTFGIPPTRPATGYGYIERGDPIDAAAPRAWRVQRFCEKPDAATARAFVAGGEMLWNSGIFVWTTSALLAAMEVGSPELARCTRAMIGAAAERDERALTEAFRTAPRTSIDYAVMEHAPRVAVVEAPIQWDDVGSFLALGSISESDADGNVLSLHDGASSVRVDSEGCVVYAEGPRIVALLGAEDLVVVAVGDAVLVCPRERAEDLKALVAELRREGRTDLL